MERGQDRDQGRERAYEPVSSGARAGREEVPGTTRQGLGDTSATDRHDAIHWEAIVAGALATLATFLLLGLLALGVDLLVDEDSGAARDWVSVVIGFVSFLVGGYVAGRILGEDRNAPTEGAREGAATACATACLRGLWRPY